MGWTHVIKSRVLTNQLSEIQKYSINCDVRTRRSSNFTFQKLIQDNVGSFYWKTFIIICRLPNQLMTKTCSSDKDENEL